MAALCAGILEKYIHSGMKGLPNISATDVEDITLDIIESRAG
jgi:hypothetical protein